MAKNCCYVNEKRAKTCRRKDNKVFKLPRRFTRKKCRKVKGFTMRSSCAPFKYCHSKRRNKTRKAKKQFLYNPKNPKKSFDVYIDKNPEDTINIKYKTKQDIKNTIRKLERLYKEDKYSHKRIWQVGMIMKVRLEAMYKYRHTRYKKAKNIPSRFKLAKKYFEFLGSRSEEKDDHLRKEMVFKEN